jgi:hypothetical protein
VDPQLRWSAASRRSWRTSLVCLALVRLRLQPCFNCCSAVLHMPPNLIADRALPFVAPAIERVYWNSQETGAGASGRCTCFPDPGPELVIFS